MGSDASPFFSTGIIIDFAYIFKKKPDDNNIFNNNNITDTSKLKPFNL